MRDAENEMDNKVNTIEAVQHVFHVYDKYVELPGVGLDSEDVNIDADYLPDPEEVLKEEDRRDNDLPRVQEP